MSAGDAESQIRQKVQDFFDGWNAGHGDGTYARNYFHPDVVRFAPGEEVQHNAEAAVQSLGQYAEKGAGHCKLDLQEVQVAGDWAYVRIGFSLDMPEGKTMSGRTLGVLKKEVNGWCMYREMFNTADKQ